MALVAMTNADVLEYVSKQDPCRVRKQLRVPIDPNDPSKGDMEVKPPDGAEPEWEVQEGATKFRIRGLDVYLTAAIYDGAQVIGRSDKDQEVRIHTNINKTNVEAVRHGLVGIENFCDDKGHPIKFETSKAQVNGREYTVADDSVLNRLGIQLIQELGAEIKAMSEVRPALQKN